MIGRRLPEARRSTALGIAGALGSVGQFVMLSLAQHLIGGVGWAASLNALAVTSGLMAPLAFVLTRPGPAPAVVWAFGEYTGAFGQDADAAALRSRPAALLPCPFHSWR